MHIDLSIVIAVKNEANYISECLNSIIKQNGLIFEVIIVDDDSSDNTYQIIKENFEKFPFIKILKNSNPGKTRAFNLGVKNSIGKYVCLFAGDDIMPEHSLYKRFKIVEDYSNEKYIVGLSKLLSFSKNKRFDGLLTPKKNGVGGFTGTSYLMNRNVVDKIFPVPEELPNEDSWLFFGMTLFKEFHIIHSDIVSNFWRVHENNSINMMVDFKTFNSKITPRNQAPIYFLEKFENELSNTSKIYLKELIRCENLRIKGHFIEILFADLPFIEKLRLISISNSFFYFLRSRFFKIFSGL